MPKTATPRSRLVEVPYQYPITAEMRPTPRSGSLGFLADMLMKAKSKMNNAVYFKDEVPILGGVGAGDMLLGNAPEEINEWSYGNSPFEQNRTGAGRYIPVPKEGRAMNLIDVAFLPVAEVAAAAKLASVGARAIGRKAKRAISSATSTSRRDFIKKGAAATGAVVAGRGLVDMADNVGAGAAKTVARSSRITPAMRFRFNEQGFIAQAKEFADANSDVIAMTNERKRLLDEANSLTKSYAEKHEPEMFRNLGTDKLSDIEAENFLDAMESQAAPDQIKQAGELEAQISRKRNELYEEKFNELMEGFKKANPELRDFRSRAEWHKKFMESNPDEITEIFKNEKNGLGLSYEDAKRVFEETGEYIDPVTGNRLIKDEYGNILWYNGRETQFIQDRMDSNYEIADFLGLTLEEMFPN